MVKLDQVWFVTGASSGLGLALTSAVLNAGGSVVATVRGTSGSDAVDSLKAAHGARLLTPRLDVVDDGQARSAAGEAVTRFGRVDVLVNNAGRGSFGALEEIPDTAVRDLFETNVFGSLNVLRAMLPQMRKQRRGHVVQVSSLAGVAPPAAGLGVYAATKFAVEGFAEVLAKEVEHLGIQVTIVEPGDFRTRFGQAIAITPVNSEDYTASVGRSGENLTHLNPGTFGDPDLAATAIINAVTSSNPPLRLPLGRDAVSGIRSKLSEQLTDLDRWEHLSLSTTSTGGAPAAVGR